MRKSFLLLVALCLLASAAFSQEPTTAEAFQKRGLARFDQEEYSLAIADFTKAIQLKPEVPDYYYARGATYLTMANGSREKLQLSLADLSKALQIDPKIFNALSARAAVRRKLGDLAGAIADVTQEMTLAEPSSVLFSQRAGLLFEKGDLDASIADMTKAIQLNPKDYDAYKFRAEIYSRKKQHQLAIADLTKVIDMIGSFAHAYDRRSEEKLFAGDTYGSIADSTLEIENTNGDGSKASAYQRRAWIYFLINQLPQSLADMQKAQELDASGSLFRPFVTFLVTRKMNKVAEANEVLNKWSPKYSGPSEFDKQVISYLQNKTTAIQLLAAAADDEKKLFANTYIGLNLWASGNKVAANKYLQFVMGSGARRYNFAYDLVRPLARLSETAKP